jgi:hypothetical protein
VFFTGAATNADVPGDAPPGRGRVAAYLLDPQDAVLAKWVKDSGGKIDLVLRSDAAHEVGSTQAVNADTVIERFRFRVPLQGSTTTR